MLQLDSTKGRSVLLVVSVLVVSATCLPKTTGAEPVDIWHKLAPGETTRSLGERLPFRKDESPPVTRVVNITRAPRSACISLKSPMVPR